jgi:hypothetical protein
MSYLLSPEVTLQCIIYDHQSMSRGTMFTVDVSYRDQLATVKKKVAQQRNVLQSDPDALKLYTPGHSISCSNADQFNASLKSFAFKESDTLNPTMTVEATGLRVPDPEYLHIIVQLPDSSPERPSKRARLLSPAEKLLDNFYAQTAPSTAAQYTIYSEQQIKQSRWLLDDRPKLEQHMPPISLLYPGFGTFLDIFNGVTVHGTHTQHLSGVNLVALERAVDVFATKMCCFYDDEKQRRDTALICLNAMLDALPGEKPPNLIAGTIGSVITDGHVQLPNGLCIEVLEVKKEEPGTNTIAYVQGASYVCHSHRQWLTQNQ